MDIRFKHRQLSMHNVLSLKVILDKGRPLFDQLDNASDYLKEAVVGNDLYNNGPFVYIYNPANPSDEFVMMTTLGGNVTMSPDKSSAFSFDKEIIVDTDYWYRQWDMSEEIPYQALQERVQADGKKIVYVYNAVLEFYGQTMTDVYYEVEPQ